MQSAASGKEKRLAGARPYPYLRGLEYLRELSNEEEELATTLVALWRPRIEAAGTVSVCDFGSGFGDLALRTLSCLGEAYPSTVMRIELVDAEPALAEHARLLLERELGFPTTSWGTHEFFVSDSRFDLILASHVLYYVQDRAALIAALLRRLNSGGLASFVIRAERCDAFKVRSAMRAVERPGSTRHRSPRVTAESIRERVEGEGLSVLITEREMEVVLPAEILDVERAFRPGPASPAQEFIRFLFHISPNTPAVEYERCVEEEIAARRDDRWVRFSLVDAVVTALND